MNLERQSVLRSALEFVNTMTIQGKPSNAEKSPPPETREECQAAAEATAPPAEIFYMLLKGNMAPFALLARNALK